MSIWRLGFVLFFERFNEVNNKNVVKKSLFLGYKLVIKFIYIFDYVFMNCFIISYNVFR